MLQGRYKLFPAQGTSFEGSDLSFRGATMLDTTTTATKRRLRKETQLTVKRVRNRRLPQILYDLHEHGEAAARIEVPASADPFALEIGTRMALGAARSCG